MRHKIALLLLVIAAVGMTGCTPDSDQAPGVTPIPTDTAPTNGLTPTPTNGLTPAPDPQVVPPDDGVMPGGDGEGTPVLDDAARQAAINAAQGVVIAYFRPDMAYDAWWAQLDPLLTARAARTYVATDPANTPALVVTGPGIIVDDSSVYMVDVSVPTSLGDFLLVMSRQTASAPWLMARMDFPENVG